jgi:hypothetical protein
MAEKKKLRFGNRGKDEVAEGSEKQAEVREESETENVQQKVEQQFDTCMNQLVNMRECTVRSITTGVPLNVIPMDAQALSLIIQFISKADRESILEGLKSILEEA